jgi:excisionase family DNA binding protein
MFHGGARGVPEFCEWAGIGRTKAYEEIRSGRLPVVKVGRRTLIRISDAEVWLSSLPKKNECQLGRTRHGR